MCPGEVFHLQRQCQQTHKLIVELGTICLSNIFTQYGNQFHTKKNGIKTGGNHSVSLANINVRYILQLTADLLSEAELFRRFVNDITWITASETSNGGIRPALTSVFAHSDLELTFRQTCTADQTGVVEFLDVSSSP